MQNKVPAELIRDRNKTVLFVNFSDTVFSSVEKHQVTINGRPRMIVDENCKWEGEDYTFQPGDSRYMPKWKAMHFAKHLVNRELVRNGHENDTSPKKIEDNPNFMELWEKALIEDPSAQGMSESMAEDDMLNKNKDLEIAKLKAQLAAATGKPVAEVLGGPVAPVTPAVAPVETVAPKKAEKTELITPTDDEDDEEFVDPTEASDPADEEKPKGYAPGEERVPFDPAAAGLSTGGGTLPASGGAGGTGINTAQ